jgi:hypothetical protein
MAILEGVLPEHGQGMIGFAHTLNDAEIAAVTNYMQDLGGSKVSISAERVKTLRAGAKPRRCCGCAWRDGAVVLALLVLAVWWRRRSARTVESGYPRSPALDMSPTRCRPATAGGSFVPDERFCLPLSAASDIRDCFGLSSTLDEEKHERFRST